MIESSRILTEAQCVALAERVFGFRQGGGEAGVNLTSHWSGEVRWGRNRVTLASDRQRTSVEIWRSVGGSRGSVTTNQFDPAALQSAVRAAERFAGPPQIDFLSGPLFRPEYLKPTIWSDATYELTAEERGRVVRGLLDPAEAQGLVSAGYIAAEAGAYAAMTTQGQRLYSAGTQSRCAITVRDQRGTGSGWAGRTSYDWSKVNAPALAERALQKCVASRDPVALEPGRYTVILEPQAVADLLSVVMDSNSLDRDRNEHSLEHMPFFLQERFSKLGLKVADERVSIWSDPMDPELGTMPFDDANPHGAIKWIDKGVLSNLYYNRGYAQLQLTENLARPLNHAWRMAGGDTSVADMVATTRRGLLVTRLSGIRVLDGQSLLVTGLTRDGLWLIENGKITKPVKNFRFTESPLFVLNSLDQLGPPEPVFRPGNVPRLRPAVVPPLKVKDFSFTSLVDAV